MQTGLDPTVVVLDDRCTVISGDDFGRIEVDHVSGLFSAVIEDGDAIPIPATELEPFQIVAPFPIAC